MRTALPARGAFGLRGRIVGALFVTAFATLAVAAVALLGPLEHSLQDAVKATIVHEFDKTPSPLKAFQKLPLGYLSEHSARTKSSRSHSVPPSPVQQVQRAETRLQTELGGDAIVTVLGYPGLSGIGSHQLVPPREDSDEDDTFDDAPAAFRTGRRNYSFGTIDGTEYARAAIPFTNADNATHAKLTYVLAVRKSVAEIPDVVHHVRDAFLYAALAGLVIALLLGIPLSARLVRRLRRLREAALELAGGAQTVAVPVDRARDEVGDLGRTLVTMQQLLGRQEEARRAFVATASHELRTPLTSLDGMLELLDDDLHYAQPDLEDARALLARARAQSRRLGRLAADLLDLSRIDAQVELRSEPVELGELSRAVLAEFELGTQEREIATALSGYGPPVWARGDPGSIARILRILLDNAVRASPAGSLITVSLLRGELAGISVSDQGSGVDPSERDAIFRRFHRGRNTAGEAGFGLGLAIGRELAERMGGRLLLDDGPAPGATFRLQLPATTGSPDDLAAADWPPPAARAAS